MCACCVACRALYCTCVVMCSSDHRGDEVWRSCPHSDQPEICTAKTPRNCGSSDGGGEPLTQRQGLFLDGYSTVQWKQRFTSDSPGLFVGSDSEHHAMRGLAKINLVKPHLARQQIHFKDNGTFQEKTEPTAISVDRSSYRTESKDTIQTNAWILSLTKDIQDKSSVASANKKHNYFCPPLALVIGRFSRRNKRH